VLDERGLGFVEMPDVVLGRVLRAALVEQCPHAMLEVDRVVAFADDVVLMEDVTKEMSVTELVNYPLSELRSRGLEPVRIAASERDVQRDDVFDFISMDGAVTHCGACGGEPVQERLRGFRGRTFEEIIE
jgi:hypothetical protein